MIIRGVARALEEQCGILFVVAIHDNGIEMHRHQLLHRGKRFRAGNYFEVQLAKDLCYGPSRLLIGTKEECLVTHIMFIVGTPVSRIKLRW